MSGREPIDPIGHFDLAPGSAWEDVQVRYRHLVQHWHPDRHPDATRAEAQAEFIEIVATFKRLRRHYERHGRLPERVPGIDSRPASPTAPDRRTTRLRAVARSPLTAVLVALGLALALATLVVVLDDRLERERRAEALSRTLESDGRGRP